MTPVGVYETVWQLQDTLGEKPFNLNADPTLVIPGETNRHDANAVVLSSVQRGGRTGSTASHART